MTDATRHLAALIRTRDVRVADARTVNEANASTLDRKAHLARLLDDEEAAQRYADEAARLRSAKTREA